MHLIEVNERGTLQLNGRCVSFSRGYATHVEGRDVKDQLLGTQSTKYDPEIEDKSELHYTKTDLSEAEEKMQISKIELLNAKEELPNAETKLRRAKEELRIAKEELRRAKEELRTADVLKQDALNRYTEHIEKLEQAEASGVTFGLKVLHIQCKEAELDLHAAKKIHANALAGVDTAQAGVDTAQSNIDSLQKMINASRLSMSMNALPSNLGEIHWWQSLKVGGNVFPLDKHKWCYDEVASTYLQELESVDPICIPVDLGTASTQQCEADDEEQNLHVFEMERSLQHDESSTSTTLVLPKSTRDFWETVCEVGIRPDKINRLLVVGTPGMGKSRSINYFLRVIIQNQRNLPAEDDRSMPVIVFAHRKDKRVWLFAPENPNDRYGKYSAFKLSLHDFAEDVCSALNMRHNYYIVDTAMAENADMPILCNANTIYVCSPDPRHYSEYEKHSTQTFYFPCWRQEYIRAAAQYMVPRNSPLTPDEAVARAQVVGPIPRRVYGSQENYDVFQKRIDNFIQDKQQDAFNVLQTGAYAIQSRSGMNPRSTIFMYETSLASSFKVANIHIVSYYARMRLDMNCLKLVMSTIRGNTVVDRQTEYGRLFEVATTHLIWKIGLTSDLISLAYQHKEGMTGGRLEPVETKRKISIAKCPSTCTREFMMDNKNQMYAQMKKLETVNDVCAGPNHTIFYVGKNFPLIDAADARNRGYNFTLQNSPRTLDLTAVANVRAKLGLKGSEIFNLIYIVDEGKANTFQVSFTKVTSKNKSLLKKVSVHVMALPNGFVQDNTKEFMNKSTCT